MNKLLNRKEQISLLRSRGYSVAEIAFILALSTEEVMQNMCQ